MNKNDNKNANLVRKSMQATRCMLLSIRLQHLKVSDILIATKLSKSRFFRFFGTINTILELVVSEELEKSYDLMANSLSPDVNKNYALAEINLLRIIYFRKNLILNNYYSCIQSLPPRYKSLIDSISVKDKQLYNALLGKYHNHQDRGFIKRPEIPDNKRLNISKGFAKH
ncbi:hypothetical protein AB3466_10470 [Sphingobacterium thalpophilum]|uniref:hypothetical protein n=1 Tax=Sphingobacterium TaxID=28453 RepID=UPI00224468DC|nr:hypothetical protein [Sphingobacterium sp. InxBP1]MCW8311856.1 hypothetical protein [Sphingobacterium sp. InxBP1]